MPPRNPMSPHTTVIRRLPPGSEPPTEGPAVDALIRDPQGVLNGWTPPVPAKAPVAAPPLPKSVREETERAKEAFAEGSRYAYRGEKPVRITVDLPKGLHRALKLRAVEEGLEIRAIVIRALADAGIVEP